MHRKKEEVILIILAQESLDLELWLKRYEFLKFWSYFCGFSKARDLFVNIFQILGPNCKFLDSRLILEKPRGLSAKCLKLKFPKGNPCTESTSPWTASGADPRWTTVTVSEEARQRTAGMVSPCTEPHRG
jgi:hypothetical protein